VDRSPTFNAEAGKGEHYKPLPSQSSYTPKEWKYLQYLLHSAALAEDTLDEEELELSLQLRQVGSAPQVGKMEACVGEAMAS
jgi:hypothetical protein